jgi:hypothetical protein
VTADGVIRETYAAQDGASAKVWGDPDLDRFADYERGSSRRITDHERVPPLVGFDAKDAEPRYTSGGQRPVEDSAEAVDGEAVVS